VGDHILLIGMMGAGKSTVGRILARRFGCVFRDSDEEITAKTGRTVAEIFASRGEAAFRAEEKAVLARALTSPVPAVIAVAGGAVFDPDSRRRIRQSGHVVWLRASPNVLAVRVAPLGVVFDHRPLLAHDPRGTLKRLEAMRRPVYTSLADAIVDVDWLPPAVAAERAERLIRQLA
jgi:shikimate kinase